MKIYHESQWIEVETTDPRIAQLRIHIERDARIEQDAYIEQGACIGQGARIEQDAYIGQGARIGQGVFIKQGARIEQDAYIGQGARIDTLVISSCGRYTIVYCNNMLAIGCELHSLAEWENDFDAIASRHNESEDDLKYYRDQIQRVKRYIG
jgi:tetrahydrodipicolinate N-succinyltransferase